MPIKLKEYLAVARPVVTTDFPALTPYRHLVRVAKGPEEFAAEVRAAINAPFDPLPGHQAIQSESWDAKADEVEGLLEGLFAGEARDRAA